MNYIYDWDNILEELDSTGNTVVAQYTQGLGIDEPLAMTRGGATSYYEADGLGSITSLSDSTGALAASYTYDSFGNLTASTGTVTNPFRYTGREFDSETGLYYYRARYYDPTIGRFISEDPIGFNGGVDFFTYVANSPTNWVDPSGLKVYRCCRDVQINPFINGLAKGLRLKHCFIKTDNKAAGMGPATGGPLPACPVGIPTRITNHSADVSQSDCKEVPGVDEACVDQELTIGEPTGRWTPTNNCNTVTDRILTKCKQKYACPLKTPPFFVPILVM